MSDAGRLSEGAAVGYALRLLRALALTIKRATWPTPPRTAGALLKAFEGAPVMDAEALDFLDEAQTGDRPPEDPWRDG